MSLRLQIYRLSFLSEPGFYEDFADSLDCEWFIQGHLRQLFSAMNIKLRISVQMMAYFDWQYWISSPTLSGTTWTTEYIQFGLLSSYEYM